MRFERLVLTAALAIVASCGGTKSETAPAAESAPAAEAQPAGAPAGETPASTTAPAAASSGGEGVAWDSMTHEQKAEHMKHVVLPAMAKEFAAWDPGEFGKIKCATCHGAGARDKTFKMPNPRLPKLPTTEEGFKALAAKEPEAVKFMSEKVVPMMAQMLGKKPYDHATQQGFGCFACHTPKN